MTRFLVTGATGFIGSAVMRRLAADGHEAIALTADLLAEELPDLSSSGATHCVHAAWYTDHADYLTHEINREWMAASLRLAEAFPGRFVGLGTCLEYDVASAAGPLGEDSPERPDTLYARCKLDLLEALAARGSDFAWARIFFVYGPGDRDGRLVPQMIERFARGEVAGPPTAASGATMSMSMTWPARSSALRPRTRGARSMPAPVKRRPCPKSTPPRRRRSGGPSWPEPTAKPGASRA